MSGQHNGTVLSSRRNKELNSVSFISSLSPSPFSSSLPSPLHLPLLVSPLRFAPEVFSPNFSVPIFISSCHLLALFIFFVFTLPFSLYPHFLSSSFISVTSFSSLPPISNQVFFIFQPFSSPFVFVSLPHPCQSSSPFTIFLHIHSFLLLFPPFHFPFLVIPLPPSPPLHQYLFLFPNLLLLHMYPPFPLQTFFIFPPSLSPSFPFLLPLRHLDSTLSLAPPPLFPFLFSSVSILSFLLQPFFLFIFISLPHIHPPLSSSSLLFPPLLFISLSPPPLPSPPLSLPFPFSVFFHNHPSNLLSPCTPLPPPLPSPPFSLPSPFSIFLHIHPSLPPPTLFFTTSPSSPCPHSFTLPPPSEGSGPGGRARPPLGATSGCVLICRVSGGNPDGSPIMVSSALPLGAARLLSGFGWVSPRPA
ncbi:hypothetical protein C7M84_022759 [Penaeus vannamei]|uniref:Uncharacterized protein n=1 Tax=Penaeus vannamei TaxID=6689 RepID=A0A3R7MKB7_PENVA|nr:hypothetical protein C7M84_022759 [Penaeus vannamei]